MFSATATIGAAVAAMCRAAGNAGLFTQPPPPPPDSDLLTIEGGAAQQTNFDRYPLPRMAVTPKVDVSGRVAVSKTSE